MGNATRPKPPSLDEPLVPRRMLVGIGAVVVLGIGAWIAYDVMVVTDAERVGQLADDVTGTMGPDAVTRGLRWIDVDRQALEVSVYGDARSYVPGQGAELEERARSGLRRFDGTKLRMLRRSIEVTGDQAHLTLQLLGDDAMANVDFSLRRHGADWLLSRVYVH